MGIGDYYGLKEPRPEKIMEIGTVDVSGRFKGMDIKSGAVGFKTRRRATEDRRRAKK